MLTDLEDFKLEIEAQEKTIHDMREALANRVWKAILLPFCKKHRAELQISAYATTLILPDGTELDVDENLADKLDDPDANDFHEAIRLEVMRVELFDYDTGHDVTKEHLYA